MSSDTDISGLGSLSALRFSRKLPWFILLHFILFYFISVWAVVISVRLVGGWFAFAFATTGCRIKIPEQPNQVQKSVSFGMDSRDRYRQGRALRSEMPFY